VGIAQEESHGIAATVPIELIGGHGARLLMVPERRPDIRGRFAPRPEACNMV